MRMVRLAGESSEACHPTRYLSVLAMRDANTDKFSLVSEREREPEVGLGEPCSLHPMVSVSQATISASTFMGTTPIVNVEASSPRELSKQHHKCGDILPVCSADYKRTVYVL